MSVEKYGLPVPPANEEHDAALLQVPQRAPPDVGLGELLHADRRHHPRLDPPPLEGVLEREGVDHGGEHPHVVGGDAVHPLLRRLRPPHDVATADHEPERDAALVHLADFVGNVLHRRPPDPEAALAREGFARELEQDPAVSQIAGHVNSRPHSE